jgi:hypothetical protein
MRKHHHPTLKLHTIYTLMLTLVFGFIFYFVQDITVGALMVALALYVAGNGIIHARKNTLHRDTAIEYLIVALIAFVLLIGALR